MGKVAKVQAAATEVLQQSTANQALSGRGVPGCGFSAHGRNTKGAGWTVGGDGLLLPFPPSVPLSPSHIPNGGYLVNVAYLLVTTACLAAGQNPGQPPGGPVGDPKVQPAPVVGAPIPPGGYGCNNNCNNNWNNNGNNNCDTGCHGGGFFEKCFSGSS